MYQDKHIHPGISLLVSNVGAAASWLQDNLFFSPVPYSLPQCIVLKNESCSLYLFEGEPEAALNTVEGQYLTGLAHVALRTNDIDKAISWCEQQELKLQTNSGGSFYNPQVFGEGELYFNISSPFGIIFEVSQRIGKPSPWAGPIICGLDHIGVPTSDIETEIDFFAKLGFIPEFPTVTNWNPDEGAIYCSMVKKGDITLEIYQFADPKPIPLQERQVIMGLIGIAEGIVQRSPGGVRFV